MVNSQFAIRNLQFTIILVLLGTLLTPAAPLHAQTFDDEIVFLDTNGAIRVRDLNQATGRAAVQWFSPADGFVNFALADVNGDGDMEIIAVGGEGESARLVIYDPVIASGAFDPGQVINGIPWEKLYELPLPGDPVLVGAGELDVAIPGVELLYSYRAEAANQQFRLLRSIGTADGRNWTQSDLPFDGDDWSSLAIGDMDASGADEITLVSQPDDSISIYRVLGNQVETIFTNQSSGRSWRHAALGRWVANSRLRLGAVRDAPLGLPSLFVVRYSLESQDIREDYTEVFDPSPDFVFFADVNGNGDDEIFMLRSVPSTIANRARLFMRKNPNSTGSVIVFEDVLDADNGYKAGAGGDVDGDGKDEVVVIRPGKMRYYLTPDVSMAASDEALDVDGEHIAMGDLDRNGYLQELRLTASSTRIEASERSGAAAVSATVQVANGVNTEPLPFAWTVDGNPSWVTVSATSNQTPATLTIRFDARALREGLYTTNLLLTSSHPLVFQQPVAVELRFTVTAGLVVAPGGLAFVKYPCTEPFDVQSQTVQIDAQSGLSYTVSLLQIGGAAPVAAAAPDAAHIVWPSSAPWATAFSERGVAPESLTVSVDFTKLPTQTMAGQAQGVVVATMDGQPVVRVLGIAAICADYQVFLPAVQRGQ